MKSYWKNKRILITGGSGFFGSQIVKKLQVLEKNAQISIPRSQVLDLRKLDVCKRVVQDQDIVIHLAGHVGGIGLNLKIPGELFYDNLIMGVQLMEEARKAKVKKFVAIGTVCSYPKFTPVPFKEDNLWDGYPEETNASYGLAKKMLLVQAQAYRKQYGFNAIYIIPVNLYGPGDNFDLSSSHVIPALIRKFYEAKKMNLDKVEIWGTGKVTREFLYVDDAAEAVVLATEKYNKQQPINIGSGNEISIRELAEKISQLIGFKGKIVLNKLKPDGQPRRKVDSTRALKELNFKSKVSFDEGLKKMIKWYTENYFNFYAKK